MEQEKTTRQIFSKYISEKIPKKQTNIFWQLFNGIDAIFSHLELILKIYKKERNFLTASNIFSLRNLAALNGFEPKLKIPSKGILYVKVNPKLFNRVGFPLYLPAYSNLICKATKLSYYYDSVYEVLAKYPDSPKFLLTSHAHKSYFSVKYGPESLLILGRETKGLPEKFRNEFPEDCVRIPMIKEARCLNLANSAAI